MAAYRDEALSIPEKTREHFRQAIEAVPKGNFGRLARVAS